MTRWGIGPLFGILTFLYSVAIVNYNNTIGVGFDFYFRHQLGIILMVVGFLIFIYPAVTIDKYFNEGKLRTGGLYKYSRHPIYGAWIVLIIPGIIIWLGTGVTTILAAYLIFKRFIHIEEDYLLTKFGNKFVEYKAKTNAIFPKLKIKFKQW